MADTDDASRWSWIAPDGKVGSGSARELASGLKSGALPPATFVWKKTWLEWLPANRVADFVAAIPSGKGEAVREPKRAPTALTPPFRPVGAPAAPAALPPPGAPVAVELPRPPLPPQRKAEANEAPPDGRPSSFGTIGKPRGASVLGPPATASHITTAPRQPQPTLGEDPSDTKATLRPPGAVPPPPRAVQAPAFRAFAPPEEHPTPPRIPTLGGAATPRDTISDSDLSDAPLLLPSELRPALILPGAPSSAVPIHTQTPKAPAAVNLDATLGSAPFEVAPASIPIDVEPPSAQPGQEPAPGVTSAGLSVGAPRRSSRPPVPRSLLVGMVLLAGVVALLAAGMVALVLRKGREAPVAQPSASAAPAAARAVVPSSTSCRLLAPAARLAASVHRAVPPLLADVVAGERVAVGIAEGPKNAAGLLVNIGTLDVERAFEQPGEKPLFGVVPLVGSGKATFVADRAGGELGGARTLGGALAFGITGKDLARVVDGRPQPVWPGAAAEKITDPRVASSAAGHLVAFRRGGLSGRVLSGWLGPDGNRQGELSLLEAPNVTLSGTPDAAVNGETGLVAFAGRPSPDAEWRVQLASVPKAGKPVLRSFETPPGGPGGGSIAPAVTALGKGWVLQWTEGTSGKYQVREQRLDERLEAVGEPWLVSPKGANSGQGALVATGSRLLSVFVQTTAGHDELWGASFECGEGR